MQGINPEQVFQQAYNIKIKEALSEVIFPKDKIFKGFFMDLAIAIATESRASANMDWDSFKELLRANEDSDMNLYLMGYAINIIESKPVINFRGTGIDYIGMMDDVAVMAEIWNEMAKPIQTRVQREIAVKMRLTTPNGPKLPIGNA